MKKRILATMFSIFIFATTSIISMAAEIDEIQVASEEYSLDIPNVTCILNTGDVFSPVKSIEEQISDFTETQREIAIEKMNIDQIDMGPVPYAVTWKYLDGFLMDKQEESYYCVVACCKAAMQYLTGESDDQDVIAKDLGTTFFGTLLEDAKHI